MKREHLNQQEKHVAFKTAFDTYTMYKNNNNLIGAYVVAFSILEDRMKAAYMLLHDYLKKERPSPTKHIRFADKIKAFEANGFFQKSDSNSYMVCANERNGKLHAAMWNLNEFSAEDCQKVIKLARETDKLCRELKKLSQQNASNSRTSVD
jgi:hypothetical protein